MTNISTERLASTVLRELAGITFSAGDILYALDADSLVRLPKGSAGQVLSMNAGATAPEWAAGASVSSGSFTPSITFGGAATGMTFSARSGTYRKIGSLVVAQGQIILTAKGSSTGLARITSLPFAAADAVTFPFSVYGANLTGIAGSVKATVTASADAIMYQGSATGDALVLDTNFTNTSDIRFTAVYFNT